MRVAYISLPMRERDYSRKERKQKYGGIGNHLGIGYIGAVTKELGHEVTLFDCPNEDISLNELINKVNEGGFDVIGISPFYTLRVTMARFLQSLRYDKKPFIIVGGHYASNVPEHFISNFPQIDCVIVGEGEYVIAEVLNSVANNSNSWKSVRGVVCRDGCNLIRNDRALLVRNLDEIPQPMRNIIPNQSVTPIIATRGCYENCSFCDVRSFYKNCEGPAYRWRSPENVVQELVALSKKGLRYFDIIDDNFLGISKVKGWIDTFVNEMKKANIDVQLEINTRVDTINSDVLLKLKSVGLVEVGLGIENGNQRTLEFFSKNATVAQAIKCVDTIRSLGLKVGSGFIFFEPTCRLDEILENINFLRQIKYHQFSTAMPISLYRPLVLVPGTPLFEKYKNEGKLINKYPGYEFENNDVSILWDILSGLKEKIATVSDYIVNEYSDNETLKSSLVSKLIDMEFNFIEEIVAEIKKTKCNNSLIIENMCMSLDNYLGEIKR